MRTIARIEKAAKIGREVAVGKIHAPVGQSAVKGLIECLAPAGLAFFGMKIIGHLLPLLHGFGAAGILAEFGLVIVFCQIHDVGPKDEANVVAVEA